MKKAAAFICGILCLAAALSGYTCALEETYDGVVYELYEEGGTDIVIVGYHGYKTTVKIPSEIEGGTVRAIYENAFTNNRYITKVVIPDTVTEIGEEAFRNCINLRTVELPSGLQVISKRMFADCTILNKLTIPSSVVEIDDYAFENCIMLRKLKIPASVQTLGRDVFMTCERLVLDCSENEYAAEYAANNMLYTDFKESAMYPVYLCLFLTAVVGAASIILNFLIRRYKTKMTEKKTAK